VIEDNRLARDGIIAMLAERPASAFLSRHWSVPMRSTVLALTTGVSFLLTACSPKPPVTRDPGRATGTPSAEQLANLAHQVTTAALAIHPGDVVVIDGGKHTIDLMEAVAIESEKAGGLVQLFLESDRVARAAFTEMPEQYLDQKPTYLADWFKRTTVYIAMPTAADFKALYADIPEAKLAKGAAAGQVILDMLNASPIRGAYIEYPSPASAALVGLPFSQYAEMQWAAIGTDYRQLATSATALAMKLHGAKRVHVTAPGGTDITFAIGLRPVVRNTGIVTPEAAKDRLILNRFVSLPSGSVAVAPEESTVTGVIITPKDRCKFKPVRDARYEFVGGMLARASAKEGDPCIQEVLTTYGTGMHRLGALTIGLNPALKVIEEGGDYRPSNAAGMVTLSLGDNQLLNGATKVPGGVTLDLPVTRASVEIDGQAVVQDGKLVTGATATIPD
jgi:aminopeptidase